MSINEVHETYESDVLTVEVSQNYRGRSGDVYMSFQDGYIEDNMFELMVSVDEFRRVLKMMQRADDQLTVEEEGD